MIILQASSIIFIPHYFDWLGMMTLSIDIGTKDEAMFAHSKKLCIEQTLAYYNLLLEQYTQSIIMMKENLTEDTDSKLTDQLITTLDQLCDPLKRYEPEVFEKAKIKMSLVLEKCVQDVINETQQDQFTFYESVAKRNKELVDKYNISDKKDRLKALFSIKQLICFDIISCTCEQNKRFKQNCSEQITLWPNSNIQKLNLSLSPFQISKAIQYYQEVQTFVDSRRIWKDIVGIWTLMLIKGRFQIIRKRKYSEAITYLAKREKRQKERMVQQFGSSYETLKIQLTFALSELMVLSLLKLTKMFPLFEKQQIQETIKMICNIQQEQHKKYLILSLILKYQASLSTTISLFNSFTHNLGYQGFYFTEKDNYSLLQDVFMYGFDVTKSYGHLISHLQLDKHYSVKIDQSNGLKLAGNQDVIACWPVAAKNIMVEYLNILACYIGIEKLTRNILVFKKLEFSLGSILGIKRLRKKNQSSKELYVTLIVGTLNNSFIYSQIIKGKLKNRRYLAEIRNVINEASNISNFTLIIADQEIGRPLPWRRAAFFYLYMRQQHNCRVYYSNSSQVCSSIIILYLHLISYLRVFTPIFTEDNFQETAKYLIHNQMKKIIEHQN